MRPLEARSLGSRADAALPDADAACRCRFYPWFNARSRSKPRPSSAAVKPCSS